MKRERAVWKDDEDEVVDTKMASTARYGRKQKAETHTASLRAEFQYVTTCQALSLNYCRSVYGTQKWAVAKQDEMFAIDGDSDFETFLASTSVANAITRFTHDDVKLRRRQDLNIDARATCGPVGTVSWQPLGPSSIESEPLIAFSTKSDKEVRLCRVMENGRSSKVVTSLKVTRGIYPKVVKFISPEELLVTNNLKGNSRVMLYDVETGKSHFYANMGGKELLQPQFVANNTDRNLFSVGFDGSRIVTIDQRSKQFVAEFVLNNPTVGFNWTSDGNSLFAGDERSHIYQFDLRSAPSCMARAQLETTASLSSFAMNGEGLVACGSPFGTVDILDAGSFTELKIEASFDKLVTAVDRLAFHPIHRSMLLASSRDKKNAIRVFECGNGKTLPGWPAEMEPIGRATDIGFSDCGRFLAVGCRSGRVQLYAL